MMKKGVIMEGGAMRGMFTAGVIDVLMENGIEFDGAIGVSAGAAFGVNYKSKQIGRVIRYNTRFVRDKRYGGLRVLLKTGNIYSTEFCYNDKRYFYWVNFSGCNIDSCALCICKRGGGIWCCIRNCGDSYVTNSTD